jgi:NADPH:quinone reductase-like Zn-dependent oxidoreductase
MLIPCYIIISEKNTDKYLKKIADITEAGHCTPVVDENKFSLEHIGDAHALLERGKAVGKVVVEN